jgi:hypothetical protein
MEEWMIIEWPSETPCYGLGLHEISNVKKLNFPCEVFELTMKVHVHMKFGYVAARIRKIWSHKFIWK